MNDRVYRAAGRSTHAIDDVDALCMGLESETTQKILLLEQLNQRVQSP